MKNRGLIKRNESPFDSFARKFFGEDDFFTFKPTFSLIDNNQNMGRSNIIENENDYSIQVSVPGFKKEDININLNDDVLTISSEFEDKKEETKENYCRREFVKSSFSRSFYVPDNVDIEKIDAKMEDGILNVVIPKKPEEKKENKISIKIK